MRRPLGIVAVVAAAVGAVLAVRYAGGFDPGRVDTLVQSAVDGLVPDPGLGARLIEFVGDPLPVLVLSGLLVVACLVLGRRRLAVVALAGPGVTGVVTTLLKPAIDRRIYGDFLAFPSGHTAAATALAIVLMLLIADLLRTRTVPGVLLILVGAGAAAATMALALIARGIHYPTDTIGGFCTALAVVPAIALLVDRVASRRWGTARGPG